MKQSCLNQVCGLKWFFLKILIGLGFFCGAGAEGYATPSFAYLTLKDAIALGLKESLPASQLTTEKQRLDLKELKLEEGKRQQKVDSSILGSRNEVGDSRDLEASAQETRQLVLSYQENFENGFLWKIINTQRLTTPLDGEEEETLFQKTILVLSFPLYGTAAEKNRLTNQKLKLSLENEWVMWEQEKMALQTQTAHAFLAFVMSHEQAKSAEQTLELVQQKLERNQAIKTQLTELEMSQLELDLHQVRLEFLNKKEALEQNRRQLALLIGNAASKRAPRLGPPLQLQQTGSQLKELYLRNSIVLQQLKKNIQIKQKDLKLSNLALHPDIILGGNIGQSRTNSSTNEREGNNRSLYLTLSYPFGGGQSQQIAIEQQAFHKLNLEFQRQQELIELQSQSDHLKLQSQQAMIDIHLNQNNLAQQQLQLAEDSFRIGKSIQDHLQTAKMRLIQTRLAVIQAQIDYWKHFFNIMEKTQINALSVLE